MTDYDEEITVLGLMAGTSVDGIDAALIKTDGKTVTRTGHALTTSYDKATRDAIFKAVDDCINNDGELAHRIARDHARAAEMLIAESGMRPDLIGFHGQTISHAPQEGKSLQIGDAFYLTQRLGVPTIHQFRQNDLDHGGQGAPLAPIYHQALIKKMDLSLPAALVNIGGISNASIVTTDDGKEENDGLMGFDLGPGNALMDDLAQQCLRQPYDKDGLLAMTGTVKAEIVESMMEHAFFQHVGPKSLDRKGLYDLIPEAALAALSNADRMATLLNMTAGSIMRGIKLNCPSVNTIVICGGGGLNPALMRAINDVKEDISVSRMEDYMMDSLMMDSRFIEAELMGYLAVRSRRGLPITMPATTGVDVPRSGGVLAKAGAK